MDYEQSRSRPKFTQANLFDQYINKGVYGLVNPEYLGHIRKTCLFKYTENFTTKKMKI